VPHHPTDGFNVPLPIRRNEIASSDCLKQAEDLSFEYKYDILLGKMLSRAVEHVHAMYARNPGK
jgi:hypothetical protein